mgnify:CR=1 FL=1
MVKKKRIVSKLILALVVLTAISCCFLGSTFARYTSDGTGKATVAVAKWDVSFGENAEEAVALGMISPDDTEYDAGTHISTPRSHTGDKVLVATITNNSDVEANVTVTLGTIGFVNAEGEAFTGFGEGAGWSADSKTDNPTQTQVAGLFSIKLYYCESDKDTQTATEATTPIASNAITLAAAPEAEGTADNVLNIYAEVTWTSADDSLEGNSDALDTWVGTNIAGLTSTLTFTAVQGSVA